MSSRLVRLDRSPTIVSGSARTFSRVGDSYNNYVSRETRNASPSNLQISTAPAVAPAIIERRALDYHVLVAVHDCCVDLDLTFFFSVVAVAIWKLPQKVLCFQKSCARAQAASVTRRYDAPAVKESMAAEQHRSPEKRNTQRAQILRGIYTVERRLTSLTSR